MIRRPPRSTLTDTLFPYTTLFRSFAVAWAMPIAFAGARLANSFDLVAWHFWIDNSTIASMAIEAMLSSVAIAYRIRLLSRERDTAIRQEVAARALADTDPLTGLLNRRAFLREAIGRAGDRKSTRLNSSH